MDNFMIFLTILFSFFGVCLIAALIASIAMRAKEKKQQGRGDCDNI